ncbi:MAG: hypothetical protein KDA60_03165, partial [Planctomycetales bacterium]|nr:hypothetical protein [Planctomycetales bacterium]
MSHPDTNFYFRLLPATCLCLAAFVAIAALGAGCRIQPPGGAVIEPEPLGNTVDAVNQRQEENAEQAKLIVYMHEFEINLQDEDKSTKSDEVQEGGFRYEGALRVRGMRLTPDGQDHVRQIAKLLQQSDGTPIPVIVERSQTSRRWDTEHHYPVHFNDELDALRREVVVSALTQLGVPDADEIVIVAPAYPTGL